MTAALTNFLANNLTGVVIQVATTSVYVDCDKFDTMLFTGNFLTNPIRPTAPGTDMRTSAGTYAADAATTPTAEAEALVAQQTAAAAVLAATLLATFNLLNLPPDVKTRHLHHLDPSYLMTQSDMVPFLFLTPTGGVCLSFSHLDPPMGTGVTRQPDSN